VRDIAEIEEALGRLSTGWRQLVDEGSSSHEEARRRKAPRVRGTRTLFAETRGKRPSRAIGRSRRESGASGRDSAPASALHARRTTRLRDVRCPGQSGRGKAFDTSNRAERGRAERRKPHGECNSAPDPKPPGCAPEREAYSAPRRSRLVLGPKRPRLPPIHGRADGSFRLQKSTSGAWRKRRAGDEPAVSPASSRVPKRARRTSAGSRIEAAKSRDRWRAKAAAKAGARALVDGRRPGLRLRGRSLTRSATVEARRGFQASV
jgi:hypothetical protein